jgi:hypothetical protein
MVCSVSCSISLVFIIGMIYFYNGTSKNATVRLYKQQLNVQQRAAYDRIAKERLNISIQGYILGFVLSLLVIFIYNKRIKPSSVVCLVLATSFLTNYFYYTLSPKSDWMLNHVESKEQAQAWLKMYQIMQYYYHAGLVLGILGVGIFAYAFRC